MTKTGRPPKPTALKELAGNPGKRPLPKNAPQPRGTMRRMPATRLEPLAQFTWVQLRAALEPLGLLTDADSETFELLCRHFARAIEADELVRVERLVLDGEKSSYRHPADVAFVQHSRMFLRYASEFGLTPSSRTVIGAALPGEEEKPLADILFEGIAAGAAGKDRQTVLSRSVGRRAAKALAGAGLGTLELARMAIKEGMDLTSIPGLGPASVRKLEDLQ
jgi:P27 family predicted phage terminase small subunit